MKPPIGNWKLPPIRDLPPYAAADAAFRLFCEPAKSERRSADHGTLCQRARYHLRNAEWRRLETAGGSIQTYTFLPDTPAPRGTVLLVHGWTSEASFMTAMVEPLRRSGFRVCLFDFPAHGLSSGRRVNLADCARALLWICEALHPIDAIVAHSFGGVVALWVGEGGPPLPRRYTVSKYVLISCPNRFTEVTREFARHHGLAEPARRAYEHRLERVGHRPLDTFTAANLLAANGRPALLIHARDDTEVPISNAREIAAAVKGTELVEFDGLGHRNVLFAPPVMRLVMNGLSHDTGSP
ncbi:MAG: hypothetical protein RLZ98_25 [Pseudomonadota bacterium]|jgi:pimeloyl-ACP methyl ester carboxylesterase